MLICGGMEGPMACTTGIVMKPNQSKREIEKGFRFNVVYIYILSELKGLNHDFLDLSNQK